MKRYVWIALFLSLIVASPVFAASVSIEPENQPLWTPTFHSG